MHQANETLRSQLVAKIRHQLCSDDYLTSSTSLGRHSLVKNDSRGP